VYATGGCRWSRTSTAVHRIRGGSPGSDTPLDLAPGLGATEHLLKSGKKPLVASLQLSDSPGQLSVRGRPTSDGLASVQFAPGNRTVDSGTVSAKTSRMRRLESTVRAHVSRTPPRRSTGPAPHCLSSSLRHLAQTTRSPPGSHITKQSKSPDIPLLTWRPREGAAQARQPKQPVKRCVATAPMLRQDASARRSEMCRRMSPSNDGVLQRACDGDEFRDEIKGRRDPGHAEEQEQL
jgi:hypothetical protein